MHPNAGAEFSVQVQRIDGPEFLRRRPTESARALLRRKNTHFNVEITASNFMFANLEQGRSYPVLPRLCMLNLPRLCMLSFVFMDVHGFFCFRLKHNIAQDSGVIPMQVTARIVCWTGF